MTLFGTAALVPEWLWIVPVTIIGILGAVALSRFPTAHLVTVLVGFVLVLDYTDGIQVHEALFGIYYIGYLGTWFLLRLAGGHRLINDKLDLAVALFLGYCTASLSLAPFLSDNLLIAANQWRAVITLAFYFPIRDVCRANRDHFIVMLVAVAIIGVFVMARNLVIYVQHLQSADAIWQILYGRYRINEMLMVMTLFGSLSIFLFSKSIVIRVVCSLLTMMMVLGVLAGRSRAVWIAIALTLPIFALLLSPKQRVLLITSTAGTVLVTGILAIIAFGDIFHLLVDGLFIRAASIGTAHQQDLSLVNRFYEWRAVTHDIVKSPIIGHGFGSTYSSYNIIYGYTETKYFVHSTYLGILFRHGIIGLVSFSFMAVMGIITGMSVRRTSSDPIVLAVAVASIILLLVLMINATMEEVMIATDGSFSFMWPLALLAGLRQRSWTANTSRLSPR